ncbi:acetate/propionate family kinase [Mucilaginibacter glaciei]|uniref:Acetate kinase n=1 Tax=Mucilaginibacter glaciei TaxID=2772109 RepID=A0A926NNI4_9SPHI|nr:acetate/propionate family kinase [Mucilaginibacter glaciei]MBD1393001.1 acetate/propionate family kinase [Mucilaginibacter glaciei]
MSEPATTSKKYVLTVNGGSSSIKFALFQINNTLRLSLSGEIADIGTKQINLNFQVGTHQSNKKVDVSDVHQDSATQWLMDWLEKEIDFSLVVAIGHRVVHGMEHSKPEKVTPGLLNDLKKISSYDPEHLPEEIKMITIIQSRYPEIDQVACFDTSFHAAMPRVAKLLAIPRKYQNAGIRRYGFHGLSYAYLMEQLRLDELNLIKTDRVILAHLGSGASLAAVKHNQCIDTSMGFSPASGIPMGSRTGDLDPGVAWYFMKQEKMSPAKFGHLVNHESGLLGISETSSDMRELIKIQGTDDRAAEAVDLFCYQAKKCIGSFVAALHGVDTLVFSGGIGENSPEVRERICHGLEFLGIELDKDKNTNNDPIISADTSTVLVRVIKTNEELMIARSVCYTLNYPIK